MAAPSIPPRPARTQMPAATQNMDIPRIPARPKRNVERSLSPNRDSFARSPLNDPSIHHNGKLHGSSNLGRRTSQDMPARPPSVSLPSIGQEGDEYANLTPEPNEEQNQQSKNIAGDLPLYAPKASLPLSTAKARIAGVTRTDSSQAAAAGIGKPSSETDSQIGHTLTRSTSSQASRSRPPSLYKMDTYEHDEEVGIPVIGLQVPMYPNAGDVQAPTPSSSVPPPSSGIGFFNNGGTPSARNHSRTKSGREVFQGPPDSYGLHGHGVNNKDPFEKAWYDKHPDAHAREAQGVYGPAIQEGRKEWALSSEQLNQLVHAKTPAGGIGTSAAAISTPDEQIGYLASEMYASRPSSTKPRRASSQTFAESPLRKSAFPSHEVDAALGQAKHDGAVESEAEDVDEIIHVDPPSKRISKIGGGGYDPPTQDLGPYGGNTADEGGEFLETGYGVPILASDEAAHRPESRFMQPAVDPEMEHRGNDYIETGTSPSGRTSIKSRSNSRQDIPPINLSRYSTHEDAPGTPLDDVKEYEPLFPEDDDRAQSAPAKLLKRPEKLARHQFPSRDVWEDAPESVMYQTTVDTPQDTERQNKAAEHEPSDLFESSEAEQARKAQLPTSDSFLSDAKTRKTGLNKGITSELPLRPGMTQRFPSQDIWEDSPDSSMYTTVVNPEDEEEKAVPEIPARPGQSKSVPSIPARPKPQIPARPSKLRENSNEQIPLAKSISGGSTEGDAAAPKAKPPVPARPAAGKIAALQANFMNDLNKKLGLGPVAPKKEDAREPDAEEEKAPLADARKGRAKGPQRRKPGVSPSGTGAAEEEKKPAKPATIRFAISRPMTIWEVDESGELSMGNPTEPVKEPSAETPLDVKLMAATKETAPAKASGDVETMAPSSQLEKVTSAESESGGSVDTAVQTGELDIDMMTDTKTGAYEKKTVYLGGRASQEGSVVVDADGTQHVGDADSLGAIERTGPGH